MNKEKIITGIKQRILDEQRKHERWTPNWTEIAARKIYSTYLAKHECISAISCIHKKDGLCTTKEECDSKREK